MNTAIQSNEPVHSLSGCAMQTHRFRSFIVPGLAEAATGNPAAVCMLPLSESKHRRSEIARSIGLPITTFLVPIGIGRYSISYFSQSGAQFQVCGHATAAAIRALAMNEGRRGASLLLEMPFPSFGEIAAFCIGETVHFSFPRAALDGRIEAGLMNELLAVTNIGRRDVKAVLRSSLGDVLIVLKDATTLRELKVHIGLAAKLANDRHHAHRGLIFTSKSDVRDYDVLNRAFFPAWGIDEDIACGSANCASIPYWLAVEGAPRASFDVGYPISSVPGLGHMSGRISVACDDGARDLVLSGCVRPVS